MASIVPAGGAGDGLHRVGGRTHLSEQNDQGTPARAGAPTWSPPESEPPPTVPLAYPPQPSPYPPQQPQQVPFPPQQQAPHPPHRPQPPGPAVGAYPAGPPGPPHPATPWVQPPPSPARRRRRALLVGAAVVAAVAVAVPTVERGLTWAVEGVAAAGAGSAPVSTTSGSAPTAPTAPVPVTASVAGKRLLTTMTRAVARRDERAFVGVAGTAHPTFRSRLRELYAGLRALPLASFELAPDTTRAPVRTEVRGLSGLTLPATATYRLKGWDGDPVRVPLLFVMHDEAGGRWVLADDRTTSDEQTAERLEPWLFPGQGVTSTANVLVVGERRRAAQLRRLARTLERLVADVRRVWPERTWNGKVVVYATTTTRFVRSWYGRTAAGDDGNGDRASFVAKVATLRRPGGSGPGAVRLVVTPYLLQGDRPGYVDILRHEMTHVALARLSGNVPVWLVEGAAEYTGFARRTASGDLDAATTLGRHGLTRSEVSSTLKGTWRPTLKRGPEFYRGSERTVDAAYNSAFITCLYIADRYGERTLRRLYTRSAQLGGAGLVSEADVARHERTVLKEVLRTDRARLTEDVGAYATTLRKRLVFR